MHQHHGINYLEIPCSQLEANEAFFRHVFGWSFNGHGRGYSCFLGTELLSRSTRLRLSARLPADRAVLTSMPARTLPVRRY